MTDTDDTTTPRPFEGGDAPRWMVDRLNALTAHAFAALMPMDEAAPTPETPAAPLTVEERLSAVETDLAQLFSVLAAGAEPDDDEDGTKSVDMLTPEEWRIVGGSTFRQANTLRSFPGWRENARFAFGSTLFRRTVARAEQETVYSVRDGMQRPALVMWGIPVTADPDLDADAIVLRVEVSC